MKIYYGVAILAQIVVVLCQKENDSPDDKLPVATSYIKLSRGAAYPDPIINLMYSETSIKTSDPEQLVKIITVEPSAEEVYVKTVEKTTSEPTVVKSSTVGPMFYKPVGTRIYPERLYPEVYDRPTYGHYYRPTNRRWFFDMPDRYLDGNIDRYYSSEEFSDSMSISSEESQYYRNDHY